MLVDLHAHTRAISHCCKITAEDNIALAKEMGFDGLAIANHYTADYCEPDNYENWLESYIAEWNECLRLGEKYGIRIFRGVEVTMSYDPRVHMLIYGADEAFLRNNPRLYNENLRWLYDICKQNNCALVQAHPFRNGTTIGNTKYLDGIEVNCHPIYKNSYTEEILTAAKYDGLAVTVGCDYHADTYRPMGGTILPDSIKTDRDLADYILNSQNFTLQVHDIPTGEIQRIEYKRG